MSPSNLAFITFIFNIEASKAKAIKLDDVSMATVIYVTLKMVTWSH